MAARNAKRSMSTILRENGGHDNEQYYQYVQLSLTAKPTKGYSTIWRKELTMTNLRKTIN